VLTLQYTKWQTLWLFSLGFILKLNKQQTIRTDWMNELDILRLFYDEMVLRGVTRDEVFLTLEDEAAGLLSEHLATSIPVAQVQKCADICIANEWLERTTADPNYKYLSLTEAGLQIYLSSRYS